LILQLNFQDKIGEKL